MELWSRADGCYRKRFMNEPMVPDDVVAAFARDGVVCLRAVLQGTEVAAAADAIDAVDADRGAIDVRRFDLQPG
jgi:hypothetical protein